MKEASNITVILPIISLDDLEYKVDHEGTYYDFFKFVQKLDSIK